MKVFSDKLRVTKREDGVCTLDKENFKYKSGTEEITIPVKDIQALVYQAGKRFELYYDGKLHFFYPKENPNQVARWALLVDLINADR